MPEVTLEDGRIIKFKDSMKAEQIEAILVEVQAAEEAENDPLSGELGFFQNPD